MRNTFKLLLVAFLAGFIFAGYKTLEHVLQDWSMRSTKDIELVGELAMIPRQDMGYRVVEGAYILHEKELCLTTEDRNCLLVFTRDSDMSALEGVASDSANTADIYGMVINYSPSVSYRVIGKVSAFYGLMPKGYVQINGKTIESFEEDRNSEYHMISVQRIIPDSIP